MNIYWTIYVLSVIIIVISAILTKKKFPKEVNEILSNDIKFAVCALIFLVFCPVINTIIAVQTLFKIKRIIK